MTTDPVIVIHTGLDGITRRLGIHPSLSHCLRRLRLYPKQSRVIRVSDEAHMATRISPLALPRRITFPAKPGQGESRAGAGLMPDMATVNITGRAAQ
jgi:hypothetical protein